MPPMVATGTNTAIRDRDVATIGAETSRIADQRAALSSRLSASQRELTEALSRHAKLSNAPLDQQDGVNDEIEKLTAEGVVA